MNPLALIWLGAAIAKRCDQWPELPNLPSNRALVEGFKAIALLLGVLALLLILPAMIVFGLLFGDGPNWKVVGFWLIVLAISQCFRSDG